MREGESEAERKREGESETEREREGESETEREREGESGTERERGRDAQMHGCIALGLYKAGCRVRGSVGARRSRR